jgi:hypothetical protein
MLAASASMHYEKAALLRDQIMELKQQAGLTKIEPAPRTASSRAAARGEDCRAGAGARSPPRAEGPAGQDDLSSGEVRTNRPR